MSETVDRLRTMVACRCGASGRAKQDYAAAKLAANADGREYPLGLGTGLGHCRGGLGAAVAFGCGNYLWQLEPCAPFILTAPFDPTLLACNCGNGGEWAKQNYYLAAAAYKIFFQISDNDFMGIPPNHQAAVCLGVCGLRAWGIIPGVETVVLGSSAFEKTSARLSCPSCLGTGVISTKQLDRLSVVRRFVMREEG